ncbi:MAG: hypothetical protein A2381_12425 [Bdellovibrionales bacterium RIFOXYB1_FULL_37_110]|nr:MAG: hypothetical protein A2181_05695 [Bdellovibrionales bacterium RIFOXYA1_FULL_38_20]OFZ47348.1 MAG: hypothetical protein A2417_12005 [Bdellovibrionales bacterium RIFOXYC1_FULL_37_79]OFZ58521.1 MAG: hypothetical protein A2381_12425 [Bdellovibrionales bacterium RIFOXYB1_FULL_37_110]OFZ63569.1 MAG: hypothetical protein A2577_08575 [Bdellovibrionales bacterium RIFOXYD1_FULL_36_51]OFZ65976.1 MAG: hypothetical protein A2328_09290 [Bdellovibrionales bacterium RIFOXYB2_FULL_36_6]
MKNKIIIFSALLFSLSSFAELDRKGNGGDGVVCYDDQKNILSVTLLDLYERSLGREMGNATSWQQKLQYVLNNINEYDYFRGKLYEKWLTEFDNEASFRDGIELSDISDSNHITIPKGCKIEQLAIQIEPKFEGDFRYTINNDLWSHMDAENRAGLILHEFVYREAIGYNHQDSISTRFLTAYFIANRLKNKNDKERFEFYKNANFLKMSVVMNAQWLEIKLGHFEINEWTNKEFIVWHNTKFFQTNKLEEAYLSDGFFKADNDVFYPGYGLTNFYENEKVSYSKQLIPKEIKYGNLNLILKSNIDNNTVEYFFDENGKISHLKFSDNFSGWNTHPSSKFSIENISPFESFSIESGFDSIYFNSNKTVAKIIFNYSSSISTTYKNKKIKVSDFKEVKFDYEIKDVVFFPDTYNRWETKVKINDQDLKLKFDTISIKNIFENPNFESLKFEGSSNSHWQTQQKAYDFPNKLLIISYSKN